MATGEWAAWRMGTVARTSRRLDIVLVGLRTFISEQDFTTVQDPTNLKVVMQALRADFGFQNALVMILALQTERLRGFCKGCACHSEECIRYARKGSLFVCPFDNKSNASTH